MAEPGVNPALPDSQIMYFLSSVPGSLTEGEV